MSKGNRSVSDEVLENVHGGLILKGYIYAEGKYIPLYKVVSDNYFREDASREERSYIGPLRSKDYAERIAREKGVSTTIVDTKSSF